MRLSRGISIVLALTALAGVGMGCAAGRGPGEACATENDCRADLTCAEGECTLPGSCPKKTPINCGDGCCPSTHLACCDDGNCYATAAQCREATCGSTGKSCRLSTDCCDGLICQQATKKCANPVVRPVCGNGRCETGETQTNCCADCGCPAGSTCRAGTCGSTSTVLTWVTSNGCVSGGDIQFRLFSHTRNVSWPGGNLVYVVKQGQSVSQPIACNAGEKICFGADQPITGLSWGVGIDNTDGCTDCCAACANATVSYGPLVCN